MFYEGLDLLNYEGQRADSRNGPVVVAPWPVTSVYEQPCERVLLDPRRDANPFFHLMESLWMLAGRDDAKFLDNYVRDFGSRFAEPGSGVIHGAYGYRWRYEFGYDQLDRVVERLKNNSGDRQCVIAMWDAREPTSHYATGEDDFSIKINWKDRPCNTHVYLRVRRPPSPQAVLVSDHRHVLDLTVCCRSNDIVWGAYGANAVHFSMLQEYLAGRIGVGVGVMYQVSNNWHAYVDQLDRLGDPDALIRHDPYDAAEIRPEPIMSVPDRWDADLAKFMRWHDAEDDNPALMPAFANPWFDDVACNAAIAHRLWRRGAHVSAMTAAKMIAAPDWRLACVEWLGRRIR